MVDQGLVNHIVGSKGSSIKRVQDQFKVQIHVETASAAGDKRKITVVGANEQDVDDAIEEILLERLYLPIEHNILEYVCGYNDKNLSFFFEKSGVVALNVDKNQQTGHFELVSIGTRRALDDLKTIVQTHISLHERVQ